MEDEVDEVDEVWEIEAERRQFIKRVERGVCKWMNERKGDTVEINEMQPAVSRLLALWHSLFVRERLSELRNPELHSLIPSKTTKGFTQRQKAKAIRSRTRTRTRSRVPSLGIG